MDFRYILFTLLYISQDQMTFAESPQGALIRLIELDTTLKKQSLEDIERMKLQSATLLSEILENQLLPDIEIALTDLRTRIEETGSPLTLPDKTACMEEIAFARSRITNDSSIISRAVEENDLVYNRILQHTSEIGSRRIDSIHSEIFDLWENMQNCLAEEHPELCSVVLHGLILERISHLPERYSEVIGNVNLQMKDLQDLYQSRIKDHISEIEMNLHPFIALMESCVSKMLV